MDQFITLLQQKTGIDEATARKVVAFIQEHADELPKLLSGNFQEAAQGLMGGDNEGANNPLGGILDAAKGMLGNKD